MPNWQPNWNDVDWDHAAADSAIDALRRAADLLDETAQTRRQVAAEATAEWRGLYREQFDGDLDRLLTGAQDLASEFRSAAGRIADADQRVAEEQLARVAARERWRREKEMEEAAERARHRD